MKWIEEDYDGVHGPIIDEMRNEHEHWTDIAEQNIKEGFWRGVEIAQSVAEKIINRAHKIRN